jgi:hypothetical protein
MLTDKSGVKIYWTNSKRPVGLRAAPKNSLGKTKRRDISLDYEVSYEFNAVLMIMHHRSNN